ncbi:MAG: hypothetical protein ACYTEZ_02595 [Planctomycetota bacterium]|jgi:hypothetical protein
MRFQTAASLLRAALVIALATSPALAEEDPPPSSAEAVAGEEKPPPSQEPATRESPAETEAAAKQQRAWDIEGYIDEYLRYRNVSGDNDFYSFTQFYVDATRGTGRPYHFRFNGRLIAELAGDQQPNDPLYGFWDTFDHDVQFRLYEAYFDVPQLAKGTLLVRAGRQFIDEGVYLQVDGLRIDMDLSQHFKGVDFTVIGGVPVRLSGTSVDSNWMVGAIVRARVTDRTRLRFSYYHISEFFPGINDPVVDPTNQPVTYPAEHLDDDLVGLSVWHRFQPTLRFFGRFTLLNGDANELHLRLRWFTKDGRWTAVIEWYQLFERLQNVTNDLTPYVPMLGSYQPFWRLGARVTYRIAEVWIFQGGLSHRQLENESNEGTFNHEYNHGYLAATRVDAWTPGLDLTLTANGYQSSSNDLAAVTTTADYRVSPRVRVTGGIDYSFYKYIWFNNTEHEDVWTYFARVRWEAAKRTIVTGGVSVDDARFDTWTTVFVRVTFRF